MLWLFLCGCQYLTLGDRGIHLLGAAWGVPDWQFVVEYLAVAAAGYWQVAAAEGDSVAAEGWSGNPGLWTEGWWVVWRLAIVQWVDRTRMVVAELMVVSLLLVMSRAWLCPEHVWLPRGARWVANIVCARLQASGCSCGQPSFIDISGRGLSRGSRKGGVPRYLRVAFHIIPSNSTVTFIGNTLTGGGVIAPSGRKSA
ncbi:hypothetical protein B0H16DRAFT_1480368 [Mycena metata]|uniref:Uncharacterized protein n=1 Tax=Mycena metata TaxID=1033252 RepID=A0AAD7H425_9AGAR|nr:hypothetical protein B0H16DRAFT_1480368 [Mycena metata]